MARLGAARAGYFLYLLPLATTAIAVPNRDRGDDAVGPIVCDRLHARHPADPDRQVVVCEGSILDLALHWDHDDHVVIVDAVQPGDEPGRIVTIDATVDPLPGVQVDTEGCGRHAACMAVGRRPTGCRHGWLDCVEEATR